MNSNMACDQFQEKEIIMEISNVSKSYNCLSGNSSENEVIKNLNLNIYKGEFIAILGPSGCGKSTILQMLAGSIKPTCGSIKMNGEVIKSLDWHRSIMFQYPALYPWLDVYGNIAFGNKMRKMKKQLIKENVLRYAKLVGLADKLHSKIYELSGGMRQRVALAQVLANQPSIILMDEPFSALDAITRSNMQNLLNDIWKSEDNTVVLITHDIEEALKLASRVVVLSSNPCDIIEEFDTKDITLNNDDFANNSTKLQKYIELKQHIENIIENHHRS